MDELKAKIKGKVSVVIPVYNEVGVLDELHERLTAVLSDCAEEYEIIAVDDGSTDGSMEKIAELALRDARFKGVELSRNFGQQAAVSAGLSFAGGDVVAMMDADLQDPPEALPVMFAKLEEGYDVVFARRIKRKEGPARRLAFKLFYKLLRMSAGKRMPMDAGLFSVMRRPVADQMRAFPERNRFLPGLRAWAGFRQTGVEIERGERYDAAPRVKLRGLVRLAMDAIFSFSYLPLRMMTFLGICAAVPSFGYILVVLYYKLFTKLAFPGWASTLSAVLFLGGLQLIGIGVIGEYIGRIYDEVKNRPVFVVKRTCGI